jgi:hypothetical protein
MEMAILVCLDLAMALHQYKVLIFYDPQGDAYKVTEE